MVSGGGMGLQYLFRPRVKQEPVDKGKMDDVRVVGSDYGAFIPRFWGTARFAGNVIWSNGVQHYIIDSPNSGGKGGPSAPAERTHVYQTSMALLLCRRPPTRTEALTTIRKLWADADLILGNGNSQYTDAFEAELATLAGGASIVNPDATASAGKSVTGLGSGGTATFDISAVPSPPLPQFDPDETALPKTRLSIYYKCNADKTATITYDSTPEDFELPNSFNEWTTRTVILDGFVDEIIYGYASAATANLDKITVEKFWLISVDPLTRGVVPSYGITGIVNPDIEYPTDLDDPSEYYNLPLADTQDVGTGTFSLTTPIPGEARRIYTGTETQTQDSAIVAWLDTKYGTGEGVLRASAHRGLAYILFENYTMRGARVPNFTVEAANGLNFVNDCLEDLFADVDITDYDLTQTEDLTQTGILEHTKGSRKSFIDSLARYHQFRLAEIDGDIVTVLDNGDSVGTFTANDLRAHDEGEEMPTFDAEVIIKEEHLLPRAVSVSIMNPQQEYHNESATARLFGNITATETKEYTFPIIDDLSDARLVAEKLILKEYFEDKAVEWFAMPSKANISIGDVVTVNIGGEDHLVRIEKKQSVLPIGKIRFQGVTTGYTYTDVVFQDDTTSLAPRAFNQYALQNFPRNTVVLPIISYPLYEQHKGRLGVYLAISGRGRGQGENSSLYREMADENYVLQDIIDSSTPMGLIADIDALNSHSDHTVIDSTSEVVIDFFDDVELESILQTDADRHATANLIRIGDGWIQFLTATPGTLPDNSPYRSRWVISDLWHGRFETDAALGTYADGQYAALVTPALRFFDLSEGDIGEVVRFKAVTAGQNIENAPIGEVAFSPVDGDYTIANVTTTRTLDCDNVTLHGLADVVGTIVQDIRRD